MISVINNRNVILQGEAIQLFSNRSGVSSQTWNFGDGGNGNVNDANPSVTYSTIGRKTITYQPNVGKGEKKIDFIYVVPNYTQFDAAHTHEIVFNGTTMSIDGVNTNPYFAYMSTYAGGGHVFYLSGTYSGDTIVFRELQGVSGNPNIMVNKPNEICTINTFTSNRPYGILMDTHHDFWFLGCGNLNAKYGIVMNKGVGMWTNYMGSDTPVGRDTKVLSTKVVSIHPETYMSAAGHGMKNNGLQRTQSLNYNAWDDHHLMHNYVDASRTEGAYMGIYHYFYDPSIAGEDYYPHTMKRARVAWNEVRGCGWDGLQLSCADESASIHDNFCVANGDSGRGGQNYGIVANSGWKGEIFNNVMIAGSNGKGGGLQAINYSDSKIFNNVMYTPEHFGIFQKAMANDHGGQTTYPNTDLNMVVKVWNNTFFTNHDCVRYDQDESYTPVPVNEYHQRNNICRYGPSASYGVFQQNCVINTKDVSDNYANNSGDKSLFFQDIDNENYQIPPASPVLSAGVDMTAFYNETELGLYDNNGYQIDTGNWHAGAMQDSDVVPSNLPPVCDAGQDQTIEALVDDVVLDGSNSYDPDGTIDTWLWEQDSGPSVATIVDTDQAITVVVGLIVGVYQFKLTVTDDDGANSSDVVQITVTDEPPPVVVNKEHSVHGILYM